MLFIWKIYASLHTNGKFQQVISNAIFFIFMYFSSWQVHVVHLSTVLLVVEKFNAARWICVFLDPDLTRKHGIIGTFYMKNRCIIAYKWKISTSYFKCNFFHLHVFFILTGAGSTPLHYAACIGNIQCCQVNLLIFIS